MKRAASLLLAVLMALGAFAAFAATTAKTEKKTKIYAEADDDSKSFGSIAADKSLYVLEKEDDYYRVVFGNYCGWIDEDALSVNKISPTENGTITGSAKLYKSASTQKGYVKTLKKGEKVEIVAETENWYRVAVGNDAGYVLKKYVEKEDPIQRIIDEQTELAGGDSHFATDFYYDEEADMICFVYRASETLAEIQERIDYNSDWRDVWQQYIEIDQEDTRVYKEWLEAHGNDHTTIKAITLDSKGKNVYTAVDGKLTTLKLDLVYDADEDLQAIVQVFAEEMESATVYDIEMNYKDNALYILYWSELSGEETIEKYNADGNFRDEIDEELAYQVYATKLVRNDFKENGYDVDVYFRAFNAEDTYYLEVVNGNITYNLFD